MDVNGSLSVRLHLVEAWTWSSDMLWWFVLVVAVSTLIALIHGILAVYRLHPSRQFLYIMAVIGSDSIMLITICFSLIAGKYKPTLLGKKISYCYLFNPLRTYHNDKPLEESSQTTVHELVVNPL